MVNPIKTEEINGIVFKTYSYYDYHVEELYPETLGEIHTIRAYIDDVPGFQVGYTGKQSDEKHEKCIEALKEHYEKKINVVVR